MPAWTRTFTARAYRWLGFALAVAVILAALWAVVTSGVV
jgi:FtsH-binding integral membrane protein